MNQISERAVKQRRAASARLEEERLRIMASPPVVNYEPAQR